MTELKQQLADPATNESLRHKVKQLERQNSAIPLLRKRVNHAQEEHLKYTALQDVAKIWKEGAELANGAITQATRFEIALNNMRQENTNLKKNKSVQEAIELKEKLHLANIKIDELTKAANASKETEAPEPNNTASIIDDCTTNYNTTSDAEELSLVKFQPSKQNTTYVDESARLLKYVVKLQSTVTARAANIKDATGRQGMG